MSDEHEAERGRLAQEVLDNPAYIEAHAKIEQEVIRKWQESRNLDEREQLHRLLLTLHKLKSTLEATMRSGMVASRKLAEKQSLIGRLRGND